MARLYSIDHDAFSEITTERAAYCLGFILADGYRTTNGRSVTIELKPDDACVLDYIKAHCDSSAPITLRTRGSGFAKGKELAGTSLSSIKLVADLERLGVVKNKTKHTSLPDIPADLRRHLVRGYFDGNGWIGNRQFIITACDQILSDLASLAEGIGVQLKRSVANGHPRLCGGRKQRAFLSWMYDNCDFALPRKLVVYQECW